MWNNKSIDSMPYELGKRYDTYLVRRRDENKKKN